MTEALRQVYMTPDGEKFATKAEALEHLRRPQIKTALAGVTGGNDQLSEWLLEHQESVESAFEIGTVKRVSKSEKKQLRKALDNLLEIDNPHLKFLQDNAEAVFESFRWPKVQRMTDEEKAIAARNSLAALEDADEELAEWVITNKDNILTAYAAGKPKRKVSPKAQEALAAYQAKMKAKKEAEAQSAS